MPIPLVSSTHPVEQLNLLAIGLDVAPLVKSITRAGHNAYSIDYFGDLDVQQVCKVNLSISTQRPGKSCGRLNNNFSPDKLLHLLHKMLQTTQIDGILLASGLEDDPTILSSMNDHVQIVGNKPNQIRRVRDKEQFFSTLKRLGIPHPETEFAGDLQEAKKKAKDIGYPVIIKPEKGFGGVSVKKVANQNQLTSLLKRAFLDDHKFIIQEFISGIAASASVLSTKEKVLTLTVNKQLLGMPILGQREEYGYCGNIVPLSTSHAFRELCCSTVERLISQYKLEGSNGVDFVISDQGIPMVVEVNPRFQGTLECVERVLGINIVQTHLDACNLRVLPDITVSSRHFCTRLILFALRRSQVPDLTRIHDVSDIPFPGTIIEEGEPLCSIIREGLNEAMSLSEAQEVAKSIFQSLSSLPLTL